MTLREFIKNFDFEKPDFSRLPDNFPNCDLEGLESNEVGQFNGILTIWELAGKPNSPAPNFQYSPINSRFSNLPFRIPTIERTQRQAQSLSGYKASAFWQTASLLRDLIQLYLTTITPHQYRRKNQLEDAGRSMVSTFEEGWARPSTKECLDFAGFSGASLTEVRGDVERLHTDGYLPSIPVDSSKLQLIPTPSRNFPYPPVNSRINPQQYGKLRERLREFTGREIRPEDLSYETLIEFVNKSDYLLRKSVEGLQNKVIREEKQKLNSELKNHWNR